MQCLDKKKKTKGIDTDKRQSYDHRSPEPISHVVHQNSGENRSQANHSKAFRNVQSEYLISRLFLKSILALHVNWLNVNWEDIVWAVSSIMCCTVVHGWPIGYVIGKPSAFDSTNQFRKSLQNEQNSFNSLDRCERVRAHGTNNGRHKMYRTVTI